MILYTDGGCSGNDSKDVSKRMMVMVVAEPDGTIVSERSCAGGSNNIAELEALRDALVHAVAVGSLTLEIRTDSRNNLAWATGNIGRKLNDRDRVVAIRKTIDDFSREIRMSVKWVPREENVAGHYIEKKYGL
jgi:ribonuclease HI